MFDKDLSGQISVKDFRQIMTKMGDRMRPSQVTRLIEQCDINRDGLIDYEAFVRMVEHAPSNLSFLDL